MDGRARERREGAEVKPTTKKLAATVKRASERVAEWPRWKRGFTFARNADFDPKLHITERERDLVLRACDTFINSPERSRIELRQAIVEDLNRRFEQKAEGRKV